MGGIIWLASYPKSGNTWLRVFLANYRAGGEVPVNINMLRETGYSDSRAALYERASATTLDQLDEARLHRLRPHVHRFLAGLGDEPTLVKTHNAIIRLDGVATITPEVTTGAIHMVRDPRDVAVSVSHHFDLSVDDAVDMLCRNDYRLATVGRNVFSFLGGWRRHMASWVDAPGLNTHVARYEDMLAKPRPTFAAVARYLGLEPDRGRLKRAIGFSAFDQVRSQEDGHGFVEQVRDTSRFFRQGRAGGWKDVLSAAQERYLVDANEDMMKRFGYLG